MGRLTILVGSPASGKSSWAAAHFSPTQIISADECATRLDDRSWYRAQQLLHWLVDVRCELGLPTCVDATNLLPEERLRLRDIARQYGRPVSCILLACSIDQILARDAARECPLPVPDLIACARKLGHALVAVPEEGYDQVQVISP